VRWTQDPDNLVPSTVTDPFAFVREFPDEQAVESRPDVLTFTAEPSAGRLTWPARSGCGSTSAPPPGPCTCTPSCPTSPRTEAPTCWSADRPTCKTPTSARQWRSRSGHTGYRLQPGHRLRVHLACSDYPLYIWHPGTGENPWHATVGKRNVQTLVTGGIAPSYLSISVLEDA